MAKAQKNVAPKVIDRKAVLTIDPALGKKSILALAKAANTHSGAEASVLEALETHVVPFGPMTGEQWDAFVKDLLLAELAKQPKVKDPTNYASKFKTAGLALASGLPEFKKGFGQTLKDYLDKVREPLRSAVLPDGRPIIQAAKTRGAKPKTAADKAADKAKRETDKAAKVLAEASKGSAGVSRDAEGGLDVGRYQAIATSLMGNAEGGDLLLSILLDHKPAFVTWAKDVLAKAKDTTKPAKPAKPEEPDTEARKLAKDLLAMANATEPKGKANGAAA
jgi:hypothetical protein